MPEYLGLGSLMTKPAQVGDKLVTKHDSEISQRENAKRCGGAALLAVRDGCGAWGLETTMMSMVTLVTTMMMSMVTLVTILAPG